MSKQKSVLTLLSSIVFAGMLFFILYLVSLKIKMHFTESLFLIALVLVLIGIVLSIFRSPRLMSGNILKTRDLPVDEETPDTPKSAKPISFSAAIIILTGVFLLVVDAIIR